MYQRKKLKVQNEIEKAAKRKSNTSYDRGFQGWQDLKLSKQTEMEEYSVEKIRMSICDL